MRRGIIGFLYGSASLEWMVRADLQPVHGAIFAGLYELQLERVEHGANPARSSVVQLKHAQDKSCGLAAVIQARIGKGTKYGFPG